jgi:polyisoprenyl-phosphate glycosyltransferase
MPVYREGKGIAANLREVAAVLEKAGARSELVVVDDGSPDATWSVLRSLTDEFPSLHAIRLSRNFGKELALCAGLEAAAGEAVIVMDADGQHPPLLIPEMISVWRSGEAEIVEGVKADRGKETTFSKVTAKLFYEIWSRLSGFELRGASDFKLLSRRAVDAYLSMQDRNVFFRGMTAWIGFPRKQLPFQVAERSGGNSGWSVLRLVKLALNGITAFSAIPLQMVTVAGFLFLIFAFLFGLQTLYVYLSGNAVTGFATVIFLLLIIGSLLMISLGVIGEYLARIYEEVKGRPRYIISERLGGGPAKGINDRKRQTEKLPT